MSNHLKALTHHAPSFTISANLVLKTNIVLRTRVIWTLSECARRVCNKNTYTLVQISTFGDQNGVAPIIICQWPKMPFKVMHRKEVTHSNGSYERKSRGRKLADIVLLNASGYRA